MRQYATAADLAAYPGGDAIPTADADAYLRTASRVVDEALTGRTYDTDPDTELPTDADVVQALQDAACAIVVEGYDLGVFAAGATTAWQSVSIGSVSLSGRTVAEDTPVVLGVPIPLAALVALRSVGPMQVWSR